MGAGIAGAGTARHVFLAPKSRALDNRALSIAAFTGTLNYRWSTQPILITTEEKPHTLPMRRSNTICGAIFTNWRLAWKSLNALVNLGDSEVGPTDLRKLALAPHG